MLKRTARKIDANLKKINASSGKVILAYTDGSLPAIDANKSLTASASKIQQLYTTIKASVNDKKSLVALMADTNAKQVLASISSIATNLDLAMSAIASDLEEENNELDEFEFLDEEETELTDLSNEEVEEVETVATVEAAAEEEVETVEMDFEEDEVTARVAKTVTVANSAKESNVSMFDFIDEN